MRLASLRPTVMGEPTWSQVSVHHRLTVAFVGRGREQPLGHHVVQDLRLNAILAHQRESFGHRHHRGTEHKIIHELDNRGGFGRRARVKRAPADHFEQRLAAADRIVGAGGHNSQLSRGGKIRPPEYVGGHQELIRLRMRGRQRSNRRHAVGAHDQMNRAGWKRIAHPRVTQGDVGNRGIVDKHRHHDVTVLTHVGNRCSGSRAGRHDVCNL